MANLRRIEEYLNAWNLAYKTVELGANTYTVEGVKRAGINEGEIVKTLIVRISGKGDKITRSPRLAKVLTAGRQKNVSFVGLVVRGKDRVDFKKVKRLFGPSTHSIHSGRASLRVNCELAKADEVLRVTGVPVGAVCPILLNIPIYIDRGVFELDHVHMGSGDLTRGLAMDLNGLLEAIGDYQLEEFALA